MQEPGTARIEERARDRDIVDAFEEAEEPALLVVLRVVDVVDEYRDAPGDLAIPFGKQRHHLRVVEKRVPPPAQQLSLLREDRRHPVGVVRVDRPREPLKAPSIPPRRHRPDGDPVDHWIRRSAMTRRHTSAIFAAAALFCTGSNRRSSSAGKSE